MLKDEMTGNDRDLGLALATGDFDKAAAVRLDEATNGGLLNSLNDSVADTFGLDRKAGREALGKAMGNDPLMSGLQCVMGGKVGGTNFGTDNEAIYTELEKIEDPYTRQKVLDAYKEPTGVDLKQDLEARMSGAKLDVVDALLEGDKEKAAATKIQVAADGMGTAEESLFKQLEGKKQWERDAIIAAYNAKYGEGSGLPGAKNFDAMLDSELSGLDLDKARMLAADGQVTPEFAVLYAVDGTGTDEAGIKKTLEGKTTAEVQVIRDAYNAKYGPPNGPSFDDRIRGEVSGRDGFEIDMMLEGEPSKDDPNYAQKLIERAERKYDFERGKDQGLFSSFSSSVMDLTSDSGADLDHQHDELLKMKAELAKSGKVDPKQQEQLDAILERHDITKSNYQATKDAVTNNIAMGVAVAASTVAGLVVSVVSGGTATPAVIAAISALVGGLSSMATKGVLQGNAYGTEDIGIDLAKTLLQAATAGGGVCSDPCSRPRA